MATAGFIAVILASTKRAPALAALAIPLTLVAIHFATATLSGASVNPARSLGSALVGGDLSAIWIYIVGPVVGAVLGWLAWKLVDGGGDDRLPPERRRSTGPTPARAAGCRPAIHRRRVAPEGSRAARR